jgi:hypothetical protein
MLNVRNILHNTAMVLNNDVMEVFDANSEIQYAKERNFHTWKRFPGFSPST